MCQIKLTIDTDFSFSYPSGFFSKVEQYNKNYTFSTADNSDTMYISCELGSGDAVKDVRDAANKNKSLINTVCCKQDHLKRKFLF